MRKAPGSRGPSPQARASSISWYLLAPAPAQPSPNIPAVDAPLLEPRLAPKRILQEQQGLFRVHPPPAQVTEQGTPQEPGAGDQHRQAHQLALLPPQPQNLRIRPQELRRKLAQSRPQRHGEQTV